MTLTAALCLTLCSMLTATVTVDERLARARAAEDQLEYELALDELLGALSDPAISEEQRTDANLRAGIINLVLGRSVEARLHFVSVLTRHPDAVLPAGQPPRIAAFFELVRQEVAPRAVAAPPATSTATPAATPSAPRHADAPAAGWSALTVAGVAATVGGAVLLTVGGGLATVGELSLADTSAEVDDRRNGRAIAVAGWATLAVGVLAVGAAGVPLLLLAE